MRAGILTAAALALGFLAGAAGCERDCRDGTLFLDVDLGAAKEADLLLVDVTVPGGTTQTTMRPLHGGTTGGGLEILFPGGYPIGKTVNVTLTATRNAVPVASVSKAFTLTGGCTRASIAFAAPDGGGAAHDPSFLFAGSDEGFALTEYADPGQTNLAAPGGPNPRPTGVYDGSAGNPSVGSFKVTATFTAYNQYVDAVVDFPITALRDWTGKTIHGMARLTSGAFTGAILLHASSGSDFGGYGAGAAVTPVLGTWTNLTFDISTPAIHSPTWNPGEVVELGFQFFTGDPPTTGAVYPGPIDVVFHIDTIND